LKNALVSGLLTHEIRKLIIRKSEVPLSADDQEKEQRKKKRESARGIVIKQTAHKFGEDEERVRASIKYLWEKGIITLPSHQNAEPNWDTVAGIEIDRMEIVGRLTYMAPDLFSKPKTREELNREEVKTDTDVIRFALVEEKQGDGFTGRYLVSVQRNPDKDGEYMVSEVPHESKTSAWAWWDEYKKGLGIVEPTKLEVVAGDDKPGKPRKGAKNA